MSDGLSLYNTFSRSKDRFRPLRANHVGMYVCGPTVYGPIHIGNARPFIVFDVLYRLLKATYRHVTYVRNITDIDDRIIERARERDESVGSLTERTIEGFHEDVDGLLCLRPDVEPRATDHVDGMIRLIETLIRQSVAYEAEGHVLFHVPAMSAYGQLSRRDRDDQIAGARVEVAPYKRDPADFVLWKPSSDQQPGWDSPWGRGRPGWHIECSAMSSHYLGATFDIHGGGVDLIFPHHENEIAQSCCAYGVETMARYWLHNGFVTIEDDKMAKSAGNFVTVREILDEVPADVIRYWMLSTHYRKPIDFNRQALAQAESALTRLYRALDGLADVDLPPSPTKPSKAVMDGLQDDLNTPRALAGLHELAGSANKAKSVQIRSRLKGEMLAAGELLGLFRDEPRHWLAGDGEDSEEIAKLIAKRNAARVAKNFAEADRIREELEARGIILEDGPDGTTWRRLS
ncbi:MAG: cysteine--tRNA ligase [Geminicoccaceae bacterium]